MSRLVTRGWLVRAAILIFTIALTWGGLLIEQRRTDVEWEVGRLAPETFVAEAPIEDVPDLTATEARRQEAADAVGDQYTTDLARNEGVYEQIGAVFDTVEAGVYRLETPTATTLPDAETTTSTSEDTTTTTTDPEAEPSPEGQTTTSAVEETADVTGFLFLDRDGNGVFNLGAGDAVLADVQLTIVDGEGRSHQVRTDAMGEFIATGVAAGEVTATVNGDDPRLEHFAVSTENGRQQGTATPDSSLEFEPVGFVPLLRDAETQLQALEQAFPNLQPSTREKLVALATGDVMRAAQGLGQHLSLVREAAVGEAADVLRDGIKTETELSEKRAELADNWPPVILDDQWDPAASAAAADVVAINLQINLAFDEQATNDLKELARVSVEEVLVDFPAGQTIVEEGDIVTEVQYAALEKAGLLSQTGLEGLAMLVVVALLVGMLSFYLARFRAQFWANTKRVVLFGVLFALAAAVARGTAVLVPVDNPAVGFLIPTATFGFIAAILFDARIGVIVSMAVGALAALATRDPALAVFGLLSTMTPIPFVSSISARGDLRRAIIYTALVLAPMAAAIHWFFYGPDQAPLAGLFGFVNGLFLSGLVGVTAVSFFETIFDITTTLRLLDLTDRNHPALQMLEEKARGTFNHSLMVGTLGDRAAKSIGANNLLVRAAAYYHDLGKTENPQFFIENQFGISNPHDRMPPEESAEAIRQHVIDGVELAKTYRIPAEVSEGVVSHHGDGIMRYFYHKAVDRYGEENVDVDAYRHHGHKPRSREMAILMLADALEGAARAVFADEDPSPERIRRVVERVVGEKAADGQLSESALTLGELTTVMEAFVDALVGHYHQRIPYPGFPELPAGEPGGEARPRGEQPSPAADRPSDAEMRQ